MLAAGLVDEVRRCARSTGSTPACPRCAASATARCGTCWKALPAPHAKELRERGIYATRQFAKRQLTWLIAGWGDPIVPMLDLAVFLWVPPAIRLARLLARERERHGDAALAPGGAMHDGFRLFMSWAAAYDRAGLDAAMHDARPAVPAEGTPSIASPGTNRPVPVTGPRRSTTMVCAWPSSRALIRPM
jgi:hypothetical protein